MRKQTKHLGMCAPKSSFVPTFSHFLTPPLIKSDTRKCFTHQRLSLASKHITKRSLDSTDLEMNAWRHMLWNTPCFFLSFCINVSPSWRNRTSLKVSRVTVKCITSLKILNYAIKDLIYLERQEKYFNLFLTTSTDWIKRAGATRTQSHTAAN